MSSKLDENGLVTVTAPVYASMPVGYTLCVVGSRAERCTERGFEDWLERFLEPRDEDGDAPPVLVVEALVIEGQPQA